MDGQRSGGERLLLERDGPREDEILEICGMMGIQDFINFYSVDPEEFREKSLTSKRLLLKERNLDVHPKSRNNQPFDPNTSIQHFPNILTRVHNHPKARRY